MPRVLLIGATGMVGGHALELCLRREDVTEVTALVRRPTGQNSSKLREVIHSDFGSYDGARDALRSQDLALFCLGAYTGTLPDEEFRRITVDFVLAFAQALASESPNAAVCLLSGQGADPSEKSRMSFARYKGAAEKALLAAGLPRVHIFRPGYIYPTTARQEPNFGYRAMRALYPVTRRLYPNIGISSADLARVMVEVGLRGSPEHTDPVFENRAIRALAAS
jgi:uncharacterized protein YbjT (DUF2867 family)